MGLVLVTLDKIKTNKKPYISSADGYTDDELKYHCSWDWLMPVISKCRDNSDEEYSYWENIYYSIEQCDIDTTYKAVVEFIKQTRL